MDDKVRVTVALEPEDVETLKAGGYVEIPVSWDDVVVPVEVRRMERLYAEPKKRV